MLIRAVSSLTVWNKYSVAYLVRRVVRERSVGVKVKHRAMVEVGFTDRHLVIDMVLTLVSSMVSRWVLKVRQMIVV
jgi:hypothetical protein